MKVAIIKRKLGDFYYYETVASNGGATLSELSECFKDEEYYFVELEDFLKIAKKMVGGVIAEEEQ